MKKVFKVTMLLASLLLVFLVTSCKDAIVVFDNEECTESITPTNLPQQTVFYSKDWILYQHGTKTNLNEYFSPTEVLMRFGVNGTGTIIIKDTIVTSRQDSSVYPFSYKFCKTDCNCNIIKLTSQTSIEGSNKELVKTILSMKMYSSVTIPINNGANAINGLLLMDEKETTLTFR